MFYKADSQREAMAKRYFESVINYLYDSNNIDELCLRREELGDMVEEITEEIRRRRGWKRY
jgi:hypothetical protein